MYEYSAIATRVIDGDTVRLDVDMGFGIHSHVIVRLHGINSPEVIGSSRDAGHASTLHLMGLLFNGTLPRRLVIRTFKDKKEKYGRYLAVIDADGVNVNQKMIDDGHAVAATYR